MYVRTSPEMCIIVAKYTCSAFKTINYVFGVPRTFVLHFCSRWSRHLQASNKPPFQAFLFGGTRLKK
jgi:hypothetical protein